MNSRTSRTRFVLAGGLSLLTGLWGSTSAVAGSSDPEGKPSVVASGLHNPRQLTFSPDGELYVAESGAAGTPDHGLPCQDSPMGEGKACVSLTGSVARVDRGGKVTRVVTGLPSAGSPQDAAGPSDITFTDDRSFALVIGLGGDLKYRAGYKEQGALLGTLVTGELRKKGETTVTKVADLAAYEDSDNPDETDIDSNPTGLARSGRGYVSTDAGGNALNAVRGGDISTLAVFDPVPTSAPVPGPDGQPVTQADSVPTDVVKGPDGAWYVSELVGFPFEPKSSTIWRLEPGSKPEAYATGLTNVTSLAFGKDGRLYAVEIAENGLLSTPPGTPPTGRLVKVTKGASTHETVADGLTAPYGVAIRGKTAYVTTGSVSPDAGQVVKIAL